MKARRNKNTPATSDKTFVKLIYIVFIFISLASVFLLNKTRLLSKVTTKTLNQPVATNFPSPTATLNPTSVPQVYKKILVNDQNYSCLETKTSQITVLSNEITTKQKQYTNEEVEPYKKCVQNCVSNRNWEYKICKDKYMSDYSECILNANQNADECKYRCDQTYSKSEIEKRVNSKISLLKTSLQNQLEEYCK
jgi:hypothetical protein